MRVESLKLNTAQFDQHYFDAALALSQAGVQFSDIPEVLGSYNPNAIRNAKIRMGELAKCMSQLSSGNEVAKDKIHAAQKFSSVFKVIQDCAGDKINYAQLDQAITDGITACAVSGMSLDESVGFLKSGLSSSSLAVTSRLQEYLDIATAIATSAGAEVCVEPEALCKVVQSLAGVKALKHLGGESVEKFDQAYTQAFQTISDAGLAPERIARLIQSQAVQVVEADLEAMLGEMVDIQRLVPVPKRPVTVEYVEVARKCCGSREIP